MPALRNLLYRMVRRNIIFDASKGERTMAKNRFARALGRIAHRIQGPTLGQVEEDYLAGSVSIYDLERRMQEIERGKFRSF
jgi:hypothetical protein